jgi:CrcB protein
MMKPAEVAVWYKLLCIGLAGACGTLARYGLAGLVQRWAGGVFPWGTASVNALGCLLFGIVWAATSERAVLPSEYRTYVLTGFMGAFTTFSTFVSESSQLLADGEYAAGIGNVFMQNGVGIAFFFVGMALGRVL